MHNFHPATLEMVRGKKTLEFRPGQMFRQRNKNLRLGSFGVVSNHPQHPSNCIATPWYTARTPCPNQMQCEKT